MFIDMLVTSGGTKVNIYGHACNIWQIWNGGFPATRFSRIRGISACRTRLQVETRSGDISPNPAHTADIQSDI